MVKFLVEMGQPTFSVVLPSKQDEKINGVLLAKLRNVGKKYKLQVLEYITLASGLPWETANLRRSCVITVLWSHLQFTVQV